MENERTATQQGEAFEAERPRLVRIATHVLGSASDADDIVQQAWLRLRGTDATIDNLPGWLTTVTTRLCLDHLRKRTPEPNADLAILASPSSGFRTADSMDSTDLTDPADAVALADTVGMALQVVLERLTPSERVAFVLHDSFGVGFATIAEVLNTTPTATRKLASRARAKVVQPSADDYQADWEVVDAFLAASKEGDFARLLQLLAPDAIVSADAAAAQMGTPTRLEGSQDIATMFNGAASAALPVLIGARPGAAWFHRGEARVAFDFTVVGGLVHRIDFRADPSVLAELNRRRDADPRS